MESFQVTNCSVEDLKNLISEVIASHLEKLNAGQQPDSHSELLTRNEAADFLKIDKSTLYQWTKKGKLISHGIESRVYYKKAEIEKALTKLS